jgi:hypothetical protein
LNQSSGLIFIIRLSLVYANENLNATPQHRTTANKLSMVDKYSKPNAYLSTIVDISSFGIIQNLTTREAELAKFSSVGVTKIDPRRQLKRIRSYHMIC